MHINNAEANARLVNYLKATTHGVVIVSGDADRAVMLNKERLLPYFTDSEIKWYADEKWKDNKTVSVDELRHFLTNVAFAQYGKEREYTKSKGMGGRPPLCVPRV